MTSTLDHAPSNHHDDDEGEGRPRELRREEVVRRLLDRGMPLRALEALLPGWEDAIAAATAPRR